MPSASASWMRRCVSCTSPFTTASKIVFRSMLSPCLMSVNATFLHSLPHYHDIFRRDIPLNIVDRVEDKSATRHQILQMFAHICANLLGCMSFIECILSIHPATP